MGRNRDDEYDIRTIRPGRPAGDPPVPTRRGVVGRNGAVERLRTGAGKHLRRLLVDMFTAWQMYEEVEPIEDPAGLIRAIEAEAAVTERRLTVERLRQGLEAIRDTSTDPASRQLAESMLADLATADVDEEAGK